MFAAMPTAKRVQYGMRDSRMNLRGRVSTSARASSARMNSLEGGRQRQQT